MEYNHTLSEFMLNIMIRLYLMSVECSIIILFYSYVKITSFNVDKTDDKYLI